MMGGMAEFLDLKALVFAGCESRFQRYGGFGL
jgi:hypothetical protein